MPIDVPTVTTQKNISQLPPATAPLTGNEVVMADLTVAGPTAKVTLTQIAGFVGSTGLPEAPLDGTSYARQSAIWTNAPTFTAITVGSAGPTITSGTGAPTTTQPKGSLFMRTDGAVGTTLYVSQGAGTWNAVAGV